MDRSGLISLFADLKGRDLKQDGLMIAEGKILSEELISRKAGMLALLCEKKWEKHFLALSQGEFPVLVMDKAGISRLVGFPFERGALSAAKRPDPVRAEEWLEQHPGARHLVVCPKIQNEENLGSIIRSAAALNAHAVLLGPESNDPFSRRCLKVSMAACLRLPVLRYSSFNSVVLQLKKRGFFLLAAVTDPSAETCSDESRSHESRSRALFLGSEERGLSPEEINACDARIRVPMSAGADSLNVGVAAGILLYCLFVK